MKTVKIDFVCMVGETPAEALENMTKGLGLTARVVAESGPAGGHPVAEITGESNTVNAFLAVFGYPNEDDPIY